MKLAKYVIPGLFLSLLIQSPAQAYLSIAESAEMVPQGKHQLGIEPQLITNKNSGGNVNIFLDTGLNDATSLRILLGAGSVDFNAFASVKWIPFPDVDNQPAMGLRVGGGVVREDDDNILQLQLAPLVSKRVKIDHGLLIPYIAVPFTYLNTDKENIMASNIAFGTEFFSSELRNVNLGAEIGLELNKSHSYISIFASIPFDAQNGFGK